MNRAILADMLGGEYEILEAENGKDGVAMMRQYGPEISLVLLDIVMPEMDGFGVLTTMNKYHWIEDIPVIMISAERGSSHIERAFELGITDFISRPFDALIVHRRVVN
ncbi:MAG: response regulator, partial [Oscillospiraceae bacterium]|nr:response regulator [Oscillospiraceae bacterium]